MPLPTRAEYRKAMWLAKRRGEEMSDVDCIVVSLCIVAYLTNRGPWTEVHARELEATFHHLFEA